MTDKALVKIKTSILSDKGNEVRSDWHIIPEGDGLKVNVKGCNVLVELHEVLIEEPKVEVPEPKFDLYDKVKKDGYAGTWLVSGCDYNPNLGYLYKLTNPYCTASEVQECTISHVEPKHTTTLTKREQFAMAAMQGFISDGVTSIDEIPKQAVELADKLIKELGK